MEELVDEWGLKFAKSVVSPGVKENEDTPWCEGTLDRRTKREGGTDKQRNKEAEEEDKRRGKERRQEGEGKMRKKERRQ